MTLIESDHIVPMNNLWPIGFTFQTIWTPLIVRQNYVDHGMVDIHLVFYGSFGVLSLLAALFFYRRNYDDAKVPFKAVCLLSLLCELYASVTLTLDRFNGSEAVAISGSIIGALGLLFGMFAWGCLFKRLLLKQSLAYILLAYMISFFLLPWCYILFPNGAAIILSLLVIFGTLCLVMSYVSIPSKVAVLPEATDSKMRAKEKNGTQGTEEITTKGKANAVFDDRPSQSRAIYYRLLAALVIYSFVLTLRYSPSFPLDNFTVVILYSTALLATIAMYWALIVTRSSLTFEQPIQALLVVFTIGFFLQPFMPAALSNIPSILLMVATALIYLVILMAVVEVLHVSTMHPLTIIGIWGACYGCPRLFYFALEYFFLQHIDSTTVNMALSLVALFALFIVFFLVSRKPPASHEFFKEPVWSSQEAANSPETAPEWQEIARTSELTKRECEVFALLCQGHTRRYIATHLYVSENTVKAHLKRIYAKTGIQSKYDLEILIKSSQEE